MEDLPVSFLIFLALLMLFATWSFVYLKERPDPFIAPGWFLLVFTPVFGYAFVKLVAEIFLRFINPLPVLDFVSFLVWFAFAASCYFALSESKSTASNLA